MPKSIFNPVPYGIWITRDGSEVMFSRSYHPLWRRRPGQPATREDPNVWIHWERQDYFHDGRVDRKILGELREIEQDFIAGRPVKIPVKDLPRLPKPTRRPTLRLANGEDEDAGH